MPAPPFEILHHGAVRGVTGSCHELRLVGSTSIERNIEDLAEVGASPASLPGRPNGARGKYVPVGSGAASLRRTAPYGAAGQRGRSANTVDPSPEEVPLSPDDGVMSGILIDCGLFQGAETSGEGADRDNLGIDFPIGHIRALVVTHVHIDHVGRVPYLLAAGFEGPIYCSLPSAILLPLVIEDALAVGATRDRKLIARTLERLKSQIRPLAYGKWARVNTGIGTGLEIRLQRAGHILGSAYVECRITAPGSADNSVAGMARSYNAGGVPVGAGHARDPGEVAPPAGAGHARDPGEVTPPAGAGHARDPGEVTPPAGAGHARDPGSIAPNVGAGHARDPKAGNVTTNVAAPARHRVIFSGDLGAAHTPLLPEPEAPLGCHALVIESTYGDRRHEGRADRVRRLQRVIERALANRGAVLIPAFSIGRTQELLYEIEEIIHARRDEPAARALPWNELEVVVDSPLAAKFTRVYDRLKPFWDAEALQRVRSGRDPLSFEQVRTVNSHSDHLRVVDHLQKTRYPAIVIAASGMCAGGRIINYLKALIGDPVTDILFVGYQAAGTPGRAIQQYGPEGGWVELDGERFDIRAAIHTIGGYSAHADQADLLRFVTGMQRAPDVVRIVHGEEEAKETLQGELARRLPHTSVVIPEM